MILPLPRGNRHVLEEDVAMDEAPIGASPLLDTSSTDISGLEKTGGSSTPVLVYRP
jgi:hypothetical protein